MIFVGIDGGATNTRAVLISEAGIILGQGTAGPSNYDNVGVETVSNNIACAIEQTWAHAGLPVAAADGAFFGMAGVVSDADRNVILNIGLCRVLRSNNCVCQNIRSGNKGKVVGRN